MKVTSIVSDVPVADIDAARGFYTGFLGLADEEFNLGWVARFTQPENHEDWGVYRFFVRAPDGNVYNIAQEH